MNCYICSSYAEPFKFDDKDGFLCWKCGQFKENADSPSIQLCHCNGYRNNNNVIGKCNAPVEPNTYCTLCGTYNKKRGIEK
jgi:hypothetical protein